MKEIEAIKAALAAGPTPGPWELNLDELGDCLRGYVPISDTDGRHSAFAQIVWVTEDDALFGGNSPSCEATANYIAACNPAAMTAILAHIEAQADEIEKLRADAERYRWLRKTTNYVTSHGEKIDVRNDPKLWDESIDACISAAMKGTP